MAVLFGVGSPGILTILAIIVLSLAELSQALIRGLGVQLPYKTSVVCVGCGALITYALFGTIVNVSLGPKTSNAAEIIPSQETNDQCFELVSRLQQVHFTQTAKNSDDIRMLSTQYASCLSIQERKLLKDVIDKDAIRVSSSGYNLTVSVRHLRPQGSRSHMPTWTIYTGECGDNTYMHKEVSTNPF